MVSWPFIFGSMNNSVGIPRMRDVVSMMEISTVEAASGMVKF